MCAHTSIHAHTSTHVSLITINHVWLSTIYYHLEYPLFLSIGITNHCICWLVINHLNLEQWITTGLATWNWLYLINKGYPPIINDIPMIVD